MKNTRPPKSQSQVEEIRALAYELWLQAGGPSEKALDLWLEAERRIAGAPQAEAGLQAKAGRNSGPAKAGAAANPQAARLAVPGALKPGAKAAKKAAKAR